MKPEMQPTLVEIYRREMLTFLQYVNQASPYGGTADRTVLQRVRELARTEADELAGFADYLDRNRVTLPRVGAFPMTFTNYNFVSVRKLLPELVTDETRSLRHLERDAAAMPMGDEREWVEKLAAAKRIHLNELEKLNEQP